MADNFVKKDWLMLMKFNSEENLNKLRSGQLYMKNLKYYVDLEKTTGDKNVGDKDEGQLVLRNTKFSMYTADTDRLVMQFDAPKTSINFGHLKYPVFCMFMFDYRNYVEEKLEGDKHTIKYQFTKMQRKEMPSFGDSVLIIKDIYEFINRVEKGLSDAGYRFKIDYVRYYGFNNSDYFMDVEKDNSRVAFWKKEKDSYQQECRILVDACIDDFLSVDIGDISDITVLLKTEELLNTRIEIVP